MTITRAIAVAACCLIGVAPSTADAQAYNEHVQAYRRGERDRAVAGVASPEALRQELQDWLAQALRSEREDDLNAALLLHTEAAFQQLVETTPMTGGIMPPRPVLLHFAIIERIHDALRARPAHRPFLRAWYLLWEALRQSHPLVSYPADSDYLLLRALVMFPEDGELLLAMGSRYELSWWQWTENSHRDVTGSTSLGVQALARARQYLQRSVRAAQVPSEARMRLSRVLTLLGELDAAADELAKFKTLDEVPVFRYLGLLFEGDIFERRGNLPAAARAYDQAIGLVALPQSALVARAHVAYALGERPEAATRVRTAMTLTATQADPWWWYIRGQSWRLDFYLTRARKMVQQ
jgi:tetratricopeptide (TPR) repeat protein